MKTNVILPNGFVGQMVFCVIAGIAVAGLAGNLFAAPTISRIDGVTNSASGITNGRVDMTLGKAYNGYLVVNDETGLYTWTIQGSSFGSSTGTVQLAGRSVPIVPGGWSNTQIKINVSGTQINPSRPWNWGPMSTILKVRTASGSTVESGVSIVPAIKTRVFGQCTHHVALRRYEMGKTPSPSAYGSYTTITSSWVPTKGDQLQWSINGGKHTAIVESVQGPTVASGITTFRVTITQRNAQARNEQSTLTSDFSFKGTTVMKTPVFASGSGNQAPSYYR